MELINQEIIKECDAVWKHGAKRPASAGENVS